MNLGRIPGKKVVHKSTSVLYPKTVNGQTSTVLVGAREYHLCPTCNTLVLCNSMTSNEAHVGHCPTCNTTRKLAQGPAPVALRIVID